MKAIFAGNAQPGAVGAARRLLASGLAIVTVNSPATHHALQEAGIFHQDVSDVRTQSVQWYRASSQFECCPSCSVTAIPANAT